MANIRDLSFCREINPIPPYIPTLISTHFAVSHTTAPYITVYPWSAAGFGTKYANPATPLPLTGRGVFFTSPVDTLVVTHDNAPFISAYAWSDAGFGSKFANPATVVGCTNPMYKVSLNKANNVVVAAAANGAGVCINAYEWDSVTGFGSKFANPASSSGITANHEAAFNNDDTVIAIGAVASPYIHAYTWSNATGFGAKFINPVSLPANAIYGVQFNSTGTALACSGAVSPGPIVYGFSSGFGTKFSNPATLPSITSSRSISFTPDDSALIHVGDQSPYVEAYAWDNTTGWGTKYSNPGTLPAGAGWGVAISAAGDFVGLANTGAPAHMSVYPWSVSTGFGTKVTNPATLPTGTGSDVAFGNTLL
jgi:hypothetical protein